MNYVIVNTRSGKGAHARGPRHSARRSPAEDRARSGQVATAELPARAPERSGRWVPVPADDLSRGLHVVVNGRSGVVVSLGMERWGEPVVHVRFDGESHVSIVRTLAAVTQWVPSAGLGRLAS